MIAFLLVSLEIILIVLGIGVRSIETLNGNYVFGFDQGADYLAARTIAVGHKITLIGAEAGAGFAGLPGVFHGPGYRYILAVLMLFFGGNPYVAIVFLFLLSLAVLVSLYLLGKKLFGSGGSSLVAVLAAISPPLSAQARMIWAPNFSGVLVIPFLFALWRVQKKEKWMLFVTALLAASLYHFELPMAVPAILGLVLYFLFILRIRSLFDWFLILLGFVVGFAPMIFFESRHGWGVFKGLFSYLSRTSGTSQKPFNLFFEVAGDWRALSATIAESFLLPIALIRNGISIFLLAGATVYVYWEKQGRVKQYIASLLLLILGHMLVYIPYRGPVYSHYFSLLYFIYPVLGAYVLLRMSEQKIPRIIASVFGILLVVGTLMSFPKTIAKDYADYGGTAKIRGKIDAIDAIYKDAANHEYGILVFTPPVYAYPYEYIVSWYGNKKYGYTPQFIRQPTTYLLIEPDPDKPWSYNGWLETVIKTGKTEKRWKLPSGFILEKRVNE